MSSPRPAGRRSKKDKPKPKGFLKFLKFFFIILFVLVLTLSAAVAALYYTTDPQTLIDKISTELYKQYKREISIEQVQISLLKGIYLEGISMSARGGFANGTAVEFKDGSVIYNPFALLRGQLDIIKISVGGFYSSYKKIIALVGDFTQTPGQSSDSQAKLAFRLREIEIYDSQFVYDGIPLNFEARVLPNTRDIFDTTLHIRVYSMYGELSFNGKVNDGQLAVYDLSTAKFTGGAFDATVNRLIVTLHLVDSTHYSLVCRDLDADYGVIHLSTYSQFTGSYNTKRKEVTIEGMGLNINGSKVYAESLFYSVPGKVFEAVIPEFEVSAADLMDGAKGKITGSLSIEYSRKLRLTGEINFEDLSYEFVESANGRLNFDNSRAEGSIRLDSESGSLTVAISSENIETSPVTVRLSSDSLVLDPLLEYLNKRNRGSSSGSGQSSGGGQGGLPIAGIRLIANVGVLKYDKFTTESVALSASYSGSIVSVDSLSLKFMKGALTASGALSENIFAGSMVFQKGKLKEFSKLFLKESESISGTVNIDSRFRIDLNDLYDSVVDLNVNVSDGVIENLIIQDRISKVLYDIPLDYILFDSITMKAILNERTLNLMSLAFDSDQIRMNANGTLALDGEKLNADATVSIDKAFLSPLPNFVTIFTSGYEQNGWMNFHLGIENTLKEPKVKLIR